MKKLFALLLAVVMFYGCQEEDIMIEESRENVPVTRTVDDSSENYYWLGAEKIPLQKMGNKFYVMYESANEEKLMTEFSKTGIVLADAQDNDLSQYVNIKNFDAKKLSGLKTVTIEGDYEKIAPALSHAFYSAPYYKTDIGEGKLTNRFSIALKDAADLPQLEKLAKGNAVDILGVSELDGWYEMACTNLSTGNALEMGNLFYETGLFESVGYDLGARGRIESINEPLYTNGTLWHLGNNTTSPNIHINYIAARTIVPQVSSSVKVAIIDSGTQYGHSDLYNVQQGWDAETQTSPNMVSNPHGTFVAGFIAAKPNNGQAVAGVAYGATILPISFSVDPNGNAILSSYEVMVRAVNRAVSEGAKVINCSWSYSDNRVVNAVKGALNSGRIVVFASGNSSGAVSSPANSDPRIIVVGAIGKTGARASFSNYGLRLDVVAPGYNVTSTTVGSGYAYSSDSGTSFAAPQVAAIAALILSENPNFTQQQVEYRIESTAQKVGGYSFVASFPHPNGTWNGYMGYGVVDAYGALTNTPPIVPNIPIISEELVPHSDSNMMTVVYSVDNPQSRVTYQWEVNGSINPNISDPNIAFLSASLHNNNNIRTILPSITLRCRTVFNGITSAWSDSTLIHFVQSLDPITPPI